MKRIEFDLYRSARMILDGEKRYREVLERVRDVFWTENGINYDRLMDRFLHNVDEVPMLDKALKHLVQTGFLLEFIGEDLKYYRARNFRQLQEE